MIVTSSEPQFPHSLNEVLDWFLRLIPRVRVLALQGAYCFFYPVWMWWPLSLAVCCTEKSEEARWWGWSVCPHSGSQHREENNHIIHWSQKEMKDRLEGGSYACRGMEREGWMQNHLFSWLPTGIGTKAFDCSSPGWHVEVLEIQYSIPLLVALQDVGIIQQERECVPLYPSQQWRPRQHPCSASQAWGQVKMSYSKWAFQSWADGFLESI
jgi:hypothetical protein